MKQVRISKSEARRFLVQYHGLDGSNCYAGREGILAFIRRVGCIQYDPLNVVGRNADLVLQSRIQGYAPPMLEEMLYTERSLIDGWDKMMAIYALEDWPFFHRLRAYKEQEVRRILSHRHSLEAVELTGKVREQLERRGPLRATQIDLGSAGTGRWGHRRLSGAALDYMFSKGEVGIHRKQNTQKVYDLIENLLPAEVLSMPDPFPSEGEFCKWCFRRRVGSIGLFRAGAGDHLYGPFLSDKASRAEIVSALIDEGHIVAVSIAGIDEPYYMRAEDYALLEAARSTGEPVTRFIAPLDNLLWDRTLIEQLFDFRYSWEVYLPRAKRTFGYYVIPVLYGCRLVARFDPDVHRGHNPLEIKNWWWEDGIAVSRSMELAVLKGLSEFVAYLQADGIHIQSTRPRAGPG